MSKLYISSLCLTDLLEQAKASHPAFTRSAKNGKVYAALTIWANDTPDQYGNHLSVSLVRPKDSQEKTIYVGQGKLHDPKVTARDLPVDDLDHIPVAVSARSENTIVPADDLPF